LVREEPDLVASFHSRTFHTVQIEQSVWRWN
jgi:hypothetical protein